MIKASHRVFNKQTQTALLKKVDSYLGEDADEYNKYRDSQEKYNLGKLYKFDIGRNCDGFSPLIREVMAETDLVKEAVENLVDYPDNHYRLLTSYLARLYGIQANWFVVSSGLESIIDILARVFFDPGDTYLLPIPNFELFEQFSSRSGATPIFVQLKKEDNYRWTSKTTDKLVQHIIKHRPKAVWISNPINPTGQLLPTSLLEKIIVTADQHNCFVIVDEAYGEYTDQDNSIVSCYPLLDKYENLLVLRTLSKIYCLPSIRIGYMASSNRELDRAVNVYRQHFPFSWFSLFVGQIAVVDQGYVVSSRTLNLERKARLFHQLDQLSGYEFIPSESCVFLLKSKLLSSTDLSEKLVRQGFFVADHNNVTGINGENFIRLTVQNDDDNQDLVTTLKHI